MVAVGSCYRDVLPGSLHTAPGDPSTDVDICISVNPVGLTHGPIVAVVHLDIGPSARPNSAYPVSNRRTDTFANLLRQG